MTRTRSTRSARSAAPATSATEQSVPTSTLVRSPANLATPAPSPTSPTIMSASASASPATEPTNPATGSTATKPVRRTQIARIGDERLRRSALLKRRHGLYKKATELATLCDCQVAILIFDSNDRLHHYSTTENVDDVLLRYASHYRPALDVRTAREYGGSPELGTRPSSGGGANFMGGNVDAPNPSTFVNHEGHVSNLLGFNPSDPTPVDADAMMYNLVDDDGDDDDLAMVTSPVFTPAAAPSDPFGQQLVLSEAGAAFIQPSAPTAFPLSRQLSSGNSNSARRSAGIPIPTPLQIPMGQSPLGGGTMAMSPMSLPTQSPFFSAFDMMAINSPRMPASATTPTDPTGGLVSSLTRVPSSKKRRIDAVMHSDSAYVPNSPMFTPSLLASQPLPPLPPSVRGHPGNGGMSIDGTGSFASTSTTSWLGGGSSGTVGGGAAASPFQLPFTQTPTEMAADLMYSMPPSGTMPALPGNVNANAISQFMSPMTIATGTPMHGPMMTPLTIPSDTFLNSSASGTAGVQAPLSADSLMPPAGFANTVAQDPSAATAATAPAASGPLRLPPTRSLSAVFPDISLSEYLHAHPPHPATGESGEALMGTLAWDAQADVAPLGPSVGSAVTAAEPQSTSTSKMGPPQLSSAAAHAMAGQQFHPERVMSLDTILNAFSNTPGTTTTPAASAGHQLQQASSIFDFAGGRCVSPGGMVDDPEEVADEDVDLAPAAAGGGEVNESEEERRRKNVMAWPLLG